MSTSDAPGRATDRGYALALAAAAILSLTGILVRHLGTAHGLPPLELTFWRSALVVLTLGGWLAVRALLTGIEKFGKYQSVAKPQIDPDTGQPDASGVMINVNEKHYAWANYSGIPTIRIRNLNQSAGYGTSAGSSVYRKPGRHHILGPDALVGAAVRNPPLRVTFPCWSPPP